VELSEDSLLRGVERWALERLRADGAAGWRAYAKGQDLFVCTGGAWVDAVVETPAGRPGDAHRIAVGHKKPREALALHLHSWNHAPMDLPCADFEAVRARYAHSMRAQHATIVDPLSGMRLDVCTERANPSHASAGTLLPACMWSATPASTPPHGLRGPPFAPRRQVRKQCVLIEVTAAQGATGGPLPEFTEVPGLAKSMVLVHAQRCRGDAGTRGCLLVMAPAAAGKSCLIQQLIIHVGAARIQPTVAKAERVAEAARAPSPPADAP
jgi:hypothetical protein